MSKQLHVRLNDEIYDALVNLSKHSSESIQDTVSAAIMEFAGREKKKIGRAHV